MTQPQEGMFQVNPDTQLQVAKEQRNAAIEEAGLFKAAFLDCQAEIGRLRQVLTEQQSQIERLTAADAGPVPAPDIPGPVRILAVQDDDPVPTTSERPKARKHTP